MAKTINVGQKVRFDPYRGIKCYGAAEVSGEVEGVVVYVNPEHRYFTAEYEVGGQKFRISFNFVDMWGEKRNVFKVKE